MNIFDQHPYIGMFIVMMLASLLRQNKEKKR
jgi:hypothetical protein